MSSQAGAGIGKKRRKIHTLRSGYGNCILIRELQNDANLSERCTMTLLTRPASTTYASLVYITIGALTVVWSGIWLWYLRDTAPHARATSYFAYGFLFTGVVVLGIGLAVGQIGRAARNAEIPPDSVVAAVAATDKTAAANPGVQVLPPGGAVLSPAVPNAATAPPARRAVGPEVTSDQAIR